MPTVTSYTFGPFSLQPARRKLLQDGKPVPLGARAFDLLVALVEGHDRTLGKEELIRRVWADSAVEDNNLTVNISALRKALQERPHDQEYIRTVSGRGYRFVAALRADVEPPSGGMAASSPAPAETPSIAVMPFVNMSDDPAQEHFGDGIGEDIIAELSRNRWLTVIARNSSFSFKGVPIEIPEIARRLNVRYVLEGSVRRAGSQVRVTVHLVDASTNSTLFAQRYDRELADLFAMQDEITALIVEAVRPALYEAEQERSMRKHPDSIDAWSAYQRGVWHFSRHEEPESAEAHAWFQRAIELDARFAPGYYGLALVYLHDGSAFVPNAPADWQPRGEQLAARAVLLDERDSGAHSILGLARMVRGDHAGALEATGRALALNASDATAHGTRGATLVFDGRPQEGLAALAACLRLSPRDPRLRVRRAHIALGHYFGREYDAAEATAHGLVRAWPGYSFGPRMLAMVYAETGRLTQAAAALEAAIALGPAPFDRFAQARMPWYRPVDHARVVAALRLAGWTGRAD